MFDQVSFVFFLWQVVFILVTYINIILCIEFNDMLNFHKPLLTKTYVITHVNRSLLTSILIIPSYKA